MVAMSCPASVTLVRPVLLCLEQGLDALCSLHLRHQGLGSIGEVVQQHTCATTFFDDGHAAVHLSVRVNVGQFKNFFGYQYRMSIHTGQQDFLVGEGLCKLFVIGELGHFPEVLVPAATQKPFGRVEAVVYLEALDDFVVGAAAFQVGPADEVLAVASEVAVPVHKAGINGIAMGIDGLFGGVLAHDVLFIADGDEFTVFYSKSLGFGEVIIDGVDIGVVDDKVNGCFLVAGSHKGKDCSDER